MPCWYYDKAELRNTPSAADGIDYDTECRYRKEGARFIQDTGTKMELGYNTMATGVVFFHRFYMFHSFKQFPRYVTACCCLFLAGKVEETPKKCRDIIQTAHSLLTDQKFATFGDDPKEEVMTLERILLQTIKFDFQVEHPYAYLLRYAKCLKGDKAKLQKMLQMAWTFLNDSLCTTLALQYEPEVIAVALMYLAGRLSKFEVVDWVGRTERHLRWWDLFVEDVTMDLLEDVCHQVLDLYSQTPHPSAPDTPPPGSLDACPIPVKISSSSTSSSTSSSASNHNGTDISLDLADSIAAAVSSMPPAGYPYHQVYAGAPPLAAATFAGPFGGVAAPPPPPPLMAAAAPPPPPPPPPVFASYVYAPQVVPGASYFHTPPPTHRPY